MQLNGTLTVEVKKLALYKDIYQKAILVAAIMGIIILALSYLLTLLLRPMTGTFLLRADELEDEVSKKTVQIREELQRRKLLETEIKAAKLALSVSERAKGSLLSRIDISLRSITDTISLLEHRISKRPALKQEFSDSLVKLQDNFEKMLKETSRVAIEQNEQNSERAQIIQFELPEIISVAVKQLQIRSYNCLLYTSPSPRD